ncbi:protein of unknown function [Burkholderia multivorans]
MELKIQNAVNRCNAGVAVLRLHVREPGGKLPRARRVIANGAFRRM